MGFTYKRRINYYETDRMGIVHHSNYIRYMEEARDYWFEELGISVSYLEENKITIPVVGVNCLYKKHVTYADEIELKLKLKKYNGVTMIVDYEIINLKTGETVLLGETKHCFTNIEIKPINMKKYNETINKKLEKEVEM